MMEATPSPPFVVAEPDLLLQLLIVALGAPSQFCGVRQIVEREVAQQGRQRVLGGRILVFGHSIVSYSSAGVPKRLWRDAT